MPDAAEQAVTVLRQLLDGVVSSTSNETLRNPSSLAMGVGYPGS